MYLSVVFISRCPLIRLDRKSVVSRQRQTSAKGRPQVVLLQVVNFCILTSGGERSLDIRVRLLCHRVDENVLVSFLLTAERQKNRFDSFVQHVHRYLSLDFSFPLFHWQSLHCGKVDLVALQVQQLALP